MPSITICIYLIIRRVWAASAGKAGRQPGQAGARFSSAAARVDRGAQGRSAKSSLTRFVSVMAASPPKFTESNCYAQSNLCDFIPLPGRTLSGTFRDVVLRPCDVLGDGGSLKQRKLIVFPGDAAASSTFRPHPARSGESLSCFPVGPIVHTAHAFDPTVQEAAR